MASGEVRKPYHCYQDTVFFRLYAPLCIPGSQSKWAYEWAYASDGGSLVGPY